MRPNINPRTLLKTGGNLGLRSGAMRLSQGSTLASKPYAERWARLQFSEQSFQLEDNCGGIPDDRLDDAFRLGRPRVDLDKDIPTIGMFGIGMKRAIFKMGQEAIVKSSSPDGVRRIHYTKGWLRPDAPDADQNWELPIDRQPAGKKHGVTIAVTELREETRRAFALSVFEDDLRRKIAIHFGYLISRGFAITVNGKPIRPDTLRLYTSRSRGPAINPYDYAEHHEGVRFRVMVGFHRPLPRIEELDDEEEAPRTKDRAGVSVVCNDRVILYNDTSFRTGWGTRTVPKFHNQFLAIGGVVSFHSNDASLLPVSTTKTGVELDSEIYDLALTQCAIGLKIFTGFTNSWKGRVSETESYFDDAVRTDVYMDQDFQKRAKRVNGARVFKPTLPKPPSDSVFRRISYLREIDDIEALSKHLFNEIRPPSDVGGEAFDQLLRRARK